MRFLNPLFHILLAGLVLIGPQAWAGEEPPRTVVLLEEAPLVSPAGETLGRAPAYTAYQYLGRRDGRLWVAYTPPQGEKALTAGLPEQAVQILPGPAEMHQKRLDRLTKVPLDGAVVRRLAAGKIQKGDSLWEVEYAWGPPDRSFMVNYFFDEQHYVYFKPGGEKILLRFVGGRLSHPPPE